jgi:hypothetical protein
MPLAGNFQQYPLPDVLGLIESGQRTGRLVAGRGAPMAHIYVVNGQWVNGERLGTGLTLAEQLVQAGLLTSAQLADLLGIQVEDTITLADSQLVRMLIGARILTQEQLQAWAMADAAAMLSIMLTWTDADFQFEDGVPVPAGQLVLPLPLGQVLAQALQTARGPTSSHDLAPLPPEVVLAFADVDPAGELAIQLTRDQWRMLTMVDGQMPLWQIADRLHAPEQLLLRVAAELVAADLAVIVGRVMPGATAG